MDIGLGTGITYALLFIALYFEIFLLVSFLEQRAVRKTEPRDVSSHTPSVAVVVPCFNEESTVKETIRSLLKLKYPKDKLDILVVDDGSTDGTLEAAEKFSSEPSVRVFHKENGGKHTAMNFALARTNAELIGCLDADSEVEPEALLNIVNVFKSADVAAVTPGIHVKKPETLLQHIQHVEYRLSIFNRFMLAGLGSAFITPGPFSVFRTEVVRTLGGWRHGHSTEDMEMAMRMQSRGYRIANAPNARVHTMTPRTLAHLFRQRVRWTYGFLRNALDYRSMLGNRSYGNLGIIVLPMALLSVFAALYFFARALWGALRGVETEITRIVFSGLAPTPTIELFYFNTSALLFLVCIAVALVLVLISLGSFIGTGKRTLPAGTPLFIALYSFLAPLWLGAALVRVALRAEVPWK
jgi:cellulose synthase/poly-beta-1,6-N-acetylglucosamine synthase-like glycosyltransferase